MNFDFNRLYMTTDGRIGRQDFWMGIVGLVIVGIVVSVLIGATTGMVSTTGLILSFILQLVLAYPAYALMAKRFQDRDKPGTYAAILIGLSILVSLFGIFGWTGNPLEMNWFGWLLSLAQFAIFIWFLIELGFLRGTVGNNQYGDDPIGAM
jgi:uncharacterized membrane protein YhaH (DUF805 family)